MSDELKVTDRRWWARSEGTVDAEEPRLKPKYVEELEAQIAEKNLEIQQLLTKYRGASDEFDQARARLRKELSKDVERGRRSLIVGFLEVLDNLDRALDAARAAGQAGGIVDGVELVRREFLKVLDRHGVTRYSALGQRFDPNQHEAIARVVSLDKEPGTVVGEIAAGYSLRGRVIRPAQVAVAADPDEDAA